MEFGLHPPEPGVVSEPGFEAAFQTRLLRGEFSGVHVVDERRALGPQAGKAEPCVPKRKDPEIPPPADRQIDGPEHSTGAERVLTQPAGRRPDTERASRSVPHSIDV